MIKIIQSSQEALKVAHELSQLHGIKDNFEVALTGSFAEGVQKKSSGLDFILKLKEKDKKNLVGNFTILKTIAAFMEEHYYNKYHIIWYDLLEEDEVNQLKKASKLGLIKNPNSPFTNIVEQAIWVHEHFGEEDIEEDFEEDFEEDIEEDIDFEEEYIEFEGIEEDDDIIELEE